MSTDRIVAIDGGRTPMKIGYLYNPLRVDGQTALEAIVEWKYSVGQLVELELHPIANPGATCLALVIECFWELPYGSYNGLTNGMKYTISRETTQEDFQRMAQYEGCFRYKVQICGKDGSLVVGQHEIMGIVS